MWVIRSVPLWSGSLVSRSSEICQGLGALQQSHFSISGSRDSDRPSVTQMLAASQATPLLFSNQSSFLLPDLPIMTLLNVATEDLRKVLVPCKPPPWTTVLLLIPLVTQCALLHPIFRHSLFARWVRLALVAPNVHWCMYVSWTYCFTPLEASGEKNMILSSMTITLAMKAIEWGFAQGPYWSRVSILIDGHRQWDLRGALQTHDLNAGPLQVGLWTFAQFTT